MIVFKKGHHMTKKTKEPLKLTRPDAANQIGVTANTLATWASDPVMRQRLPYYKEGRKVYYLESDVAAFRESRLQKIGG